MFRYQVLIEYIGTNFVGWQIQSKGKSIQKEIQVKLSKQYCDGKVVSILEGGYDLQALQESTEMHVKALLEFN